MIVNVKSRQEINLIIDNKFGTNSFFEVEIIPEGIIIKRSGDIVKKTKGTIKNLDIETIRTVAESDEFSGY